MVLYFTFKIFNTYEVYFTIYYEVMIWLHIFSYVVNQFSQHVMNKPFSAHRFEM